MSRYKILRRKKGDEPPLMRRIKDPGTGGSVVALMAACARDKAGLLADTIPDSLFYRALVKFSKAKDVPVIVPTQQEAMSISVSYSHKEVYTPETLPTHVFYAICVDVDPKELPPDRAAFLVIKRKVLT